MWSCWRRTASELPADLDGEDQPDRYDVQADGALTAAVNR